MLCLERISKVPNAPVVKWYIQLESWCSLKDGDNFGTCPFAYAYTNLFEHCLVRSLSLS